MKIYDWLVENGLCETPISLDQAYHIADPLAYRHAVTPPIIKFLDDVHGDPGFYKAEDSILSLRPHGQNVGMLLYGLAHRIASRANSRFVSKGPRFEVKAYRVVSMYVADERLKQIPGSNVPQVPRYHCVGCRYRALNLDKLVQHGYNTHSAAGTLRAVGPGLRGLYEIIHLDNPHPVIDRVTETVYQLS